MVRRTKRLWTDEEKRSICFQTAAPGVSVAQVARRYAVNANMVFKWLRDPRYTPEAASVPSQPEAFASLAGMGGTTGSIFSGLGEMLSFDGGGYTGAGSRSGGLDGKGGFLAMLHPRESVMDHTKGSGQAGGGRTHVTANVNISLDGANGDRQIREIAQQASAQGIAQVMDALPSLVHEINSGNPWIR